MSFTTEFDWFDGPSEQVVITLAGELGIEPHQLEEPLYDVIDLDALDSLFAPTYGGSPRRGRVEFSALGCRIVVDESGTVTADRSPEPPSESEVAEGVSSG